MATSANISSNPVCGTSSIPGWPYSFVAALESGRTSWTGLLDAVRLGPEDDATAVTADQLREVTGRLIEAGHWQAGDPDILLVMDAGYDVTRLAHLLSDLPLELIGRLRSDPQGHSGLDRTALPRTGHRRPVDLAGHRRPRPAPPGPPAGRRPAPPLGTPPARSQVDAGPGPSRVPQHLREDPHPGPSAETLPARPRTTTGFEEPQASTPPRRRQDRQTRTHTPSPPRRARLKIKLRSLIQIIEACRWRLAR